MTADHNAETFEINGIEVPTTGFHILATGIDPRDRDVWLDGDIIGVVQDEGDHHPHRGRFATWSNKAGAKDSGVGFHATIEAAAQAIRDLYEPPAPIEATTEIAPVETAAPAGRSYTVTYTGAGEPIVHATGCSHVRRDSQYGTHRTVIVTGDLVAVAGHVYEDFIEEGQDPADWIGDLQVKNCAR
ncbi:hypothetical protein [Embleya sp. NPDC005971]|uniref:hypothetical protein n=1 Tax=Embleya sp. NPDC005971 TaxID=3156724 RepID=UPI0033DC9C8C